MIERIIEILNNKYNIEIKYSIKFSNVYNITFLVKPAFTSHLWM